MQPAVPSLHTLVLDTYQATCSQGRAVDHEIDRLALLLAQSQGIEVVCLIEGGEPVTDHRDTALVAFLREPCEVVGRIRDVASKGRAFAKVSGYRESLGVALLVMQDGEARN